MVRFHGALAALAGGFSLVLLTFTISRNISSTPIRASVVLSSQEHPTLTRKCFLYNNVTAENVCCRMHQYKRDTDILRCIKRSNIEALASLRRNESGGERRKTPATISPDDRIWDRFSSEENVTQGHDVPDPRQKMCSLLQIRRVRRRAKSSTFPESNGTDDAQKSSDAAADLTAGRVDWALASPAPDLTGTAHWVLVGDSHLRYLFDVLIRRARGVGLQYRKKDSDEWLPAHLLLRGFRLNTTYEDFKARHLAVPFRVTFLWDPLLRRVPTLVKGWEEGRHSAPTLVILGSGLHWMLETESLYKESGPDAAMGVYSDHLHSLLHDLTRLANTVPTIFKLLDDVQTAHDNSQIHPQYNVENFDLFNRVSRNALAGTGVLVWDSGLPLAQAYTRECLATHVVTYPDYRWKCHDARHVGYILVEQYGDMIFNFACNKYMDLSSDFCL
ncbi:hypothetical protein C7M84_020524 [Penaeus vannamei]|uniref:Uncharacterized protein n=1 Tax=Penaeus vannamei TaxID=6689 RepID=A0A423SBV4_PENVA|nr:hypothetical protein C7M84_020524 [Penaeus vannamei]